MKIFTNIKTPINQLVTTNKKDQPKDCTEIRIKDMRDRGVMERIPRHGVKDKNGKIDMSKKVKHKDIEEGKNDKIGENKTLRSE